MGIEIVLAHDLRSASSDGDMRPTKISLFKALRIPVEPCIPALISAKLSFVLMVFFPQEAPFVVRSGRHDIIRNCQGDQNSIRMP